MKLTFYFENEPKVYYSQAEINHLGKETGWISDRTRIFYEAAARNVFLGTSVTCARAGLKIPLEEGISFEEFYEENKQKKNRPGLDREIWEIQCSVGMHPDIIEQLKGLIMGGFICLKKENENIRVSVEPSLLDVITEKLRVTADETRLNISVFQRITKNKLHRFIDENWKEIEDRLDCLPDENLLHITDRDFLIYDLRMEEKKPFSEIPDLVIKQLGFNDENAKINEDSVKQACHRVQKKIDTIAGFTEEYDEA